MIKSLVLCFIFPSTPYGSVCLGTRINLAVSDRCLKEFRKRNFSGISIESIRSSSELDSREKALDVSSDGVGCHNQYAVERMDIFARNRSRRVSNERRDRTFCEAEIIGRTCEAVAEDMSGEVWNLGAAEHPVPLVREAPECFRSSDAGKDVLARNRPMSILKVLNDGQAYRACRRAFFGVGQSEAAVLEVDLGPF